MGYVGNSPAEKYASFAVQHFTTSATTGYTLDHAVTNENDIRLVINNVIQQPGGSYAYTASGTTLTLSAATAGTDTMYCVFLGKAVQTVVPPEASITGAMLSDTAISGQTALGAEPADTDEFLVSDAGVLKRVDYSYIKPTAQVYRDAQPIAINGNYEIWQRGTSFTTSVYTADRWKQDLSGATATVSRQTFTVGQSDVPNNPKYHLRQTVSTANNNCGMFYRHEDVTTLTGNITNAFYAKGTNPNGGNLHIITKQDFGSGGSTAVETSTQNITLTGSWQQFVFNFSLASISGKTVGANSYLQMLIKQPDGDGSTNAWTLDLANFQVEEGTYTSATLPPFQSETYAANHFRCLRYYYRITPTTGFRYVGWCQTDNDDTNHVAYIDFKRDMRVPPSALEQSGTASQYKIREASTTTCDAVPTFNNADVWYSAVSFKKSSSGYSQGEILKAGIDGGYLGWDAEL